MSGDNPYEAPNTEDGRPAARNLITKAAITVFLLIALLLSFFIIRMGFEAINPFG